MLILWLALACGGSKDDTDDSDAGHGELVLDQTPLDPNAPIEPVAEWEKEFFEDLALIWHIPENPRGVVWVFHGTGGSASTANQMETIAILNEFVKIDIGFVAASSDDPEKWDTDGKPKGNEDLQRAMRIRDDLMGRSDWTDGTPVFTWGFSNGAKMAGTFADFALDEGWPIRAISSHNGASSSDQVPTIFVDSENDDTMAGGPIGNTIEALEDNGVAVESYMATEDPLHPMRFLRIANFNEAKSQFQFDELVDWGHVDADGVRITDVDNIEGVVNQITSESEGWGPVTAAEQLRVVWCTHRIDGRFALEERNFFAAQL